MLSYYHFRANHIFNWWIPKQLWSHASWPFCLWIFPYELWGSFAKNTFWLVRWWKISESGWQYFGVHNQIEFCSSGTLGAICDWLVWNPTSTYDRVCGLLLVTFERRWHCVSQPEIAEVWADIWDQIEVQLLHIQDVFQTILDLRVMPSAALSELQFFHSGGLRLFPDKIQQKL